MNKVAINLPDIAQRLKALPLPEVDLVVGVATGGTVPASLVAYELNRSLELITINYRDVTNLPQREAPELLGASKLPEVPSRILLVDDVSVTGKTLALAKAILKRHFVTTLVFKGKGDLVVLPEVASCVTWPWHISAVSASGELRSPAELT